MATPPEPPLHPYAWSICHAGSDPAIVQWHAHMCLAPLGLIPAPLCCPMHTDRKQRAAYGSGADHQHRSGRHTTT